MGLVNPRLDYIIILNKVLSILESAANKTVLNHDLENTVKLIKKGNPWTCPIPNTKMPAILIRRSRKQKEPKTFGNGPKRRDATLYIEIWGMIYFTEDSEKTDDEMAKLADNIEAIFRDDYSLGGTVDMCNPVSVDFDTGTKGTMMVSVCTVTLELTIRAR
jgi:hypothetical protein